MSIERHEEERSAVLTRRASIQAALEMKQLEPTSELRQMGWTPAWLEALHLALSLAPKIPIEYLCEAFFGGVGCLPGCRRETNVRWHCSPHCDTKCQQDATFPVEYLVQIQLATIRDRLRWQVSIHRGWSRLRFPDDWYSFTARDRLVQQFAWAAPTKAALDVLAALGPILELGAGMGYWAYLLRKLGVDVLAYDENPPQPEIAPVARSNIWCAPTEPWTPVFRGDAHELASAYPDRTLFICWPPMGSFCSSAVERYRVAGGHHLVYVGEPGDGCTGGFDESKWYLTQTVRIPQWHGIHDVLQVWEAY